MSIGLIQRRPVHPWIALRQAERAFDRMHRPGAPTRRQPSAPERSFDPRLEAIETEAGFEVTAEMPGVAREDLEVSVQEAVLTIKGVRRFGSAATDADEPQSTATAAGVSEDESGDTEGAETPEVVADENAARFERRIRFNAEVDENAIVARYADGVLEVRIPKATPPEPEVRTIPVQAG